MVPTKARALIPEVAGNIGIPAEDLTLLVNCYYKENKRLLSSMSHLHIKLRSLGLMTIKGWEINKEIKLANRSLEMSSNYNTIGNLKEQISNLEAIKVQWDIQEQERKEVKKKKQQYYKDKESGL